MEVKRMAKNKILSTLFVISIMTSTVLPIFAEVKMDDLMSPKDAFFRLGTTDIPENFTLGSEMFAATLFSLGTTTSPT